MSTINTVLNTPSAFTAPIALDAPATSSTSFSNTLAVAQSPKTLLTTSGASQANRPNIKEFMDRTGAAFLDASEIIYGVVGSNTDVRDWTAIMASNDPISVARQATGQMYGRTGITPRDDATYMGATDTVAKEGNFALRLLKDEDNKVVDQGLKLIDHQGLLLRDAGGSPESIARNAWLFGFDTQPLAKLAQAAGKISEGLGKTVQQASAMAPSPSTAATAATAIQPLFLATAAETESVTSTSDIFLMSARMNEAPVLTPQDNARTSAPALEEAIAEASAAAFSYVETSTYLNSLFKT